MRVLLWVFFCLVVLVSMMLFHFIGMGAPGGSISAFNPNRVWHKVTLDDQPKWRGKGHTKTDDVVQGTDEYGRRWDCNVSSESLELAERFEFLLWIDGSCGIFQRGSVGYYLTTKNAGVVTMLYHFYYGEDEGYMRVESTVGQTTLSDARGGVRQFCHVSVNIINGTVPYKIQGDCLTDNKDLLTLLPLIQDNLEFVSGSFLYDK